MLRLTLLLCIGMYAALMTLGEDRGQLRPGLAKAVAEGRLAMGRDGLELALAEPAPVAEPAPEPEPVPVALPEPEPVPEPVPEPLPETILASAPAVLPPVAEPLAPEADPLPDIAAGRNVVMVLEDPVFSLSTLGNELVPGENGAALTDPAPEPVAETETETETETATGDIWYVTASAVNVRAAPSTEAAILDKLSTGEATLMLEQVDADWARIVIQGDGVEGYVAIRYLAPGTP
jgi:hypothetical protein